MEENNTAKYHVQNNSDVEGSALSAAKKQYSQKNYNEALNLFLGVANKNPDSEVYVNIGSCYYMLNKNREATEYWNKAIELDSKNSKAYANLGNLYYKEDKIEKAISFWVVALISKPEDASTCLNLAIAFNKRNMRSEAIKYFEKYLKYSEIKNSEYLNIKEEIQNSFALANQYLMMGEQLQFENKNKQASEYYTKSLLKYPGIAKTNINLGSIFFYDKNLESAVKYWKIASHIDKSYYKIYSNIALCYDLMKSFDYAYCYYHRYMNYIMDNKEEYYKTNTRLFKLKPFLNEHPELVSKHLELAKNHLANNEFEEAIDEFKNYSIFKPEEHETYKEIIKNLEVYINPELSIIARCFETGNKLFAERRFSEAKHYFSRIMRLSSPQYLEFANAKAKFDHCEKSEG